MNATRAFAFTAIFTLAASSARAQDDTQKPVANGGYGAPEMRVTTLAGSAGILFGSQGGWVHDHVFVLGGAGYGLVNDVTPTMDGTKSAAIGLGYGGVRPGFVLGSDRFIHLTGGLLLGAGGIRAGADGAERSDVFFVVEPDVAGEMNIVRWLRLAVGASYRMPFGDTAGLRFTQVSGPAGTLALKFGSF